MGKRGPKLCYGADSLYAVADSPEKEKRGGLFFFVAKLSFFYAKKI